MVDPSEQGILANVTGAVFELEGSVVALRADNRISWLTSRLCEMRAKQLWASLATSEVRVRLPCRFVS
jgi:hypothetical protein